MNTYAQWSVKGIIRYSFLKRGDTVTASKKSRYFPNQIITDPFSIS